MAQWIGHLTTNQGIAGSNPARNNKSFVNILFLFLLWIFYKFIIEPPDGLKPPFFWVGSEFQPFGWAQTTNLSSGFKPPTFRVGSNHHFSGGLEPPTIWWARTTNFLGGFEPPTFRVGLNHKHPSTLGGHPSRYTRRSPIQVIRRSLIQVHQAVTHPSTPGGHSSKFTRRSPIQVHQAVTHPSTPGSHPSICWGTGQVIVIDRSLSRRSHDQILASHCFKDFGGNFFQRFWRKLVLKNLKKFVSKILEENCFKDFEETNFKDFGGKRFQRF